MCRLAKWIVASALMLVAGGVSAKQYAYIIRFVAKEGTPYSLSNPAQFLSQKAIARRNLQGIAIDSSDLPVNPAYVDSVIRLTGAAIHGTSRWLNMCVVKVEDTSVIASLYGKGFIRSVTPLFARPGINTRVSVKPSATSTAKKPTGSPSFYGNTWQQTSLVHGDHLHDAGYKGSGVLIAVLDAGFIGSDTHPGFTDMWAAARIVDKRNFVQGNDLVFTSDTHGTKALSTITGHTEGTYVGTAPDASVALYVTEDNTSETPVEMTNMLLASERADSAGVDIITTSLGYNLFDNSADNLVFAADLDGKTTIAAQAANTATSKGILFVASAGNEGGNSWNMVLTPGDADSALTIGSVDYTGAMAGNSGYGPNAAGRVKPDVCLMGQAAAVFQGMGYGSESGTSFATPQAAGWAACLWQEYPAATPAQIRRAITRCANSFTTPGTHNGYGVPDFSCARQMLLGVGELPSAMAEGSWVAVLPNPSDGLTRLLISPMEDTKVDFSLFDVAGRNVLNWAGTFVKGLNEPVSVNLRHLPHGMYLLQATSNTQQQILKVIIK